jgi:signal peptidase I
VTALREPLEGEEESAARAEESPEEAEGRGRTPARGRLGPYRAIINICAVGGLVAGLLYLHTRVVRVAYIPTGSMTPALRPGDRALVNLAAYRRHPPQRGDIVAFWDPSSKEHQVKRVIATAGDVISIHWGVVFLNGKLLREPYVTQPMLPETPLNKEIEPGQLFVMGDNRNASEDSRDNGPIGEDAVLGRIFFRILPMRNAGFVR